MTGNRFINYTEKDGLASNSIYSISEDAYGNIWAGTDKNGISKISNADLVKMEKPSSVGNSTMAIDKLGNKWVSDKMAWANTIATILPFMGKNCCRFLIQSVFLHLFIIDHADNIWFQLMVLKQTNETYKI